MFSFNKIWPLKNEGEKYENITDKPQLIVSVSSCLVFDQLCDVLSITRKFCVNNGERRRSQKWNGKLSSYRTGIPKIEAGGSLAGSNNYSFRVL